MTLDPRALNSLRWRSVGPHRGGPRGRGGRPPHRALDLLLRGLRRRRVEDHRRRHLLGERLRRLLRDGGGRRASPWRRRRPTSIYAGTGEACIRGNVSHGDGVYRSDDGGRTWRNVGLKDTPPHRPRARPPARSRHRLRRGARARLGAEPRARRLPLAGRRRHLGARARSRASARARSTSSLDPAQPARALRRGVAGAARTPCAHDQRRPRVAASASPPTAATPGPTSAGTRGCRRACSGASAWPSPRPTAGASRRWSRPRTARCSAPTTPARPGSAAARRRGLRGRPWYYMHVFADPHRRRHRLDRATTRCGSRIDGGKTFGECRDAARRQPRPLDRSRATRAG